MDLTYFPEDEQVWLENFPRFTANTAVEHLEIKLESVRADQIVMTMPITEKTLQPAGLLHGGITMALVESASSMHACWGKDLSKVVPVGIEINGSHIRSATEGNVRAVAQVVRRSKTLIVHQVDVYLVETGKLITTARITNFYKPVNREAQN